MLFLIQHPQIQGMNPYSLRPATHSGRPLHDVSPPHCFTGTLVHGPQPPRGALPRLPSPPTPRLVPAQRPLAPSNTPTGPCPAPSPTLPAPVPFPSWSTPCPLPPPLPATHPDWSLSSALKQPLSASIWSAVRSRLSSTWGAWHREQKGDSRQGVEAHRTPVDPVAVHSPPCSARC